MRGSAFILVGSQAPAIQATGGTAAGQRPREQLLVCGRISQTGTLGQHRAFFDTETLRRNPFFTWAFLAQFLSGSKGLISIEL